MVKQNWNILSRLQHNKENKEILDNHLSSLPILPSPTYNINDLLTHKNKDHGSAYFGEDQPNLNVKQNQNK